MGKAMRTGSAMRMGKAMRIGNTAVSFVLRSPLHPLLSGSTAVVRYAGRSSNRTITTPVRYAPHGDGFVVFVASDGTKRWWRNFRSPHAVDLLVRGTWLPMIGHVVNARLRPDEAVAALEAYLQRFPETARLIPGVTIGEQARNALLVGCVPRLGRITEAPGHHLAQAIAAHLPHVSVHPEPEPI